MPSKVRPPCGALNSTVPAIPAVAGSWVSSMGDSPAEVIRLELKDTR